MTTEILETELVDLTDLVPYEEPSDPDTKAHIVNPPDNPHISHGYPMMTAQDVVDIARAGQIEVQALCGYRFVPKHNPEKCEACETCFKIAGDIMGSLGE